MCRIRHLFCVIPFLLLFSPVKGQDVIDIQLFATGLAFPLEIQAMDDSRLCVVEKAGRLQILDGEGNLNPEPFLDIRDRVSSQASERGLLGLAFHPDFVNNGFFFVNYTDLAGNTTVARFSRQDVDHADPDSEVVLFEVDQPFSNHNGGSLAFGPDGYLYIGLGDGGSGGDPQNNGQGKQTFLGKMLRIDVDSGDPYGIPPDNPFVENDEVLDEIWATGLRNPWKFSFDRLTGNLYIADVGQNAYEEVNVQPASSPGGENYGWRCYEASEPYNLAGCPGDTAFTFPVYQYGHSGNSCRASITGGYVYRGDEGTELYGKYLFADYCKGWIGMLFEESPDVWTRTILTQFDIREISSFGQDQSGELYFAAIVEGSIYKVNALPSSSTENGSLPGPVRIFPNPVSEKLVLSFRDVPPGEVHCEILDNAGNVVYDTRVTGASVFEIQVDAFHWKTSGMLFVRLTSGGASYTEKVILAK